jgi:hypothetical protein
MDERRLRGGGELEGAAAAVPDALASFFDRARSDPQWVRVLLWETLEAGDGDVPDAAAAEGRRARYRERVAWVASEQDAGRLPDDLDPQLLLLSLLGAALYPVLLPEVCELMTGSRPDDDAFARRYRSHLRRLAAALAPTDAH